MKENTTKKIERAGLFFGAAAYSFTHSPIVMVREVKNEIKEKQKERKLKKYMKISKVLAKHLVKQGILDPDEAGEFIIMREEFAKQILK